MDTGISLSVWLAQSARIDWWCLHAVLSVLGGETGLDLGPLLLLELRNLLLAGVVTGRELVEGVLRAALKLLLDALLLLVEAQPGPAAIGVHLLEPALLKRRVCRLVAPLRMPVNLGGIRLVRERQGIEGVVDARGVESGQRLATAAAVKAVELRQVQTLVGFLDCRFGVLGRRPRWQALLLLGEQSFTLSFPPGSLRLLCCLCLPSLRNIELLARTRWATWTAKTGIVEMQVSAGLSGQQGEAWRLSAHPIVMGFPNQAGSPGTVMPRRRVVPLPTPVLCRMIPPVFRHSP